MKLPSNPVTIHEQKASAYQVHQFLTVSFWLMGNNNAVAADLYGQAHACLFDLARQMGYALIAPPARMEAASAEETFTGKAYADAYSNVLPPSIYYSNVNGELPLGTYTVTMRDGKPVRIVWEADE
jgi:hypothetical protein